MNLDGMGRNLVFIFLFDSGRLGFNRRTAMACMYFWGLGGIKTCCLEIPPAVVRRERERDGRLYVLMRDDRIYESLQTFVSMATVIM